MGSVCLVALGGKLELELEQLWAGASPQAHWKLPPCQGWDGARWVRAGGRSSPGMSKATLWRGVRVDVESDAGWGLCWSSLGRPAREPSTVPSAASTWDLEQARLCTDPLGAGSQPPTTLWFSCWRSLLVFKTSNGDLSYWCQSPGLRCLMWGSNPLLPSEDL